MRWLVFVVPVNSEDAQDVAVAEGEKSRASEMENFRRDRRAAPVVRVLGNERSNGRLHERSDLGVLLVWHPDEICVSRNRRYRIERRGIGLEPIPCPARGSP